MLQDMASDQGINLLLKYVLLKFEWNKNTTIQL